jgi:hypothetical protein
MMIALNKSSIEGIADIECAMSLMNIKYLTVIVSNAAVLKMSASINVRDIDNALHQSSSYVMLDLYLDELVDETKVREHIKREFHLVDELNANC